MISLHVSIFYMFSFLLIIVVLLNAHLVLLMNLWEIVEKKNCRHLLSVSAFIYLFLYFFLGSSLMRREWFDEVQKNKSEKLSLKFIIINPWSPHSSGKDDSFFKKLLFLLLSFIACLSFLTSSVIEHLHVSLYGAAWCCIYSNYLLFSPHIYKAVNVSEIRNNKYENERREMEEGEICWNGKHKHRNLIVNYNFIVVSTPFPLWMTLQSYVNELSVIQHEWFSRFPGRLSGDFHTIFKVVRIFS